VIFPLLSIYSLKVLVKIPPRIDTLANDILNIALIASIAWLLIRLTNVFEDYINSRYKLEEAADIQTRKIHTQVRILKKILTVIIFIVALSAILMNFEEFRQLGTGILASAGVAGLVVGLAAQRTLANLLAGIQIAITQPISIEDIVVVENEWGRIEEITLTYVVFRTWDLRRLILPISYFIEKPFHNWSKVTSELIGIVYLYVDYTVPVEKVRKEFKRILKESELWNGNTAKLQVTNTSERTMELRALMSAAVTDAWNLRCEVREKLIEFIQKNYPEGLPKIRTEIQKDSRAEIALPEQNAT
jgi:small-conductance mechanosensitive channel